MMSDSENQQEARKAKKILAIVGSPRFGGNTDILIDRYLVGAKEAGAQIEKVYLRKLSIADCIGCDGCIKAGQCIVKDDLMLLLDKMKAADIWVLGTPVYFFGPTALMKAFIDRWYGSREYVDFKGQKVSLLIPLEDTTEKTAQHTVGMLTETLNYVGADLISTLIAIEVLHKGDVNKRPDYLEKAHQMGSVAGRA